MNQKFDDLEQSFQEVASMSKGARYDLLNELAKKGFVITITLQTDDEGVFHESILFQTKEEAEYKDALKSVIQEREAQDRKWGEQNHDPFVYITILMEEVGEMSQAALETRFGGKHGGLKHLREEAVQTAAVALAIVECLDRGKWRWPASGQASEAPE